MGQSIIFQPGKHTFMAEEGETILKAAHRSGRQLPYDCSPF